ncbi:hypothetical protein F4677DRAFT_424624 [Hypoxylon crocopeplum]|nr:hypothetical protein F4677DRAFT_424624 [Hypoxylon crocopeplum]
MDSREYTKLERGSIFKTLEARLSARQSFLHGPQVQMFRVSSPPNFTPSASIMSGLTPPEEPHHEDQEESTSTIKPAENLIQMYNKRIQVMESIIKQLRSADKERQRWENDARMAHQGLEEAKLRIASLENELERGTVVKDVIKERVTEVEGEGEYGKTGEVDKDLAEQITSLEPSADTQDHTSGDLIRIHHVVWGAESVQDEALEQRLLDCAAGGLAFTANCDFIGRDTGPGQRGMLIVAYSKPPDGPMVWLIVDEGNEGKFNLQ